MSLTNTSKNIDKVNLAKSIYYLNERKRKNPISFFKPEPYQLSFHKSTKKNKGIFGGNRSGKTHNGVAYTLNKCLDAIKKGEQFSAWACTWADMLIPVLMKKYYDLLPKDGSIYYANYSEKRGFANKIIIFNKDVVLRFKTYDQGRESFQGTAKHLIHLDEEPPQDIVNECKARLIDFNGELLRTMTPLNGITYTYDEMIQNELNDTEVEYWFWDSSMNSYINQDAQKRIINSFAPKEAEVRQTGHFMNLTAGNAYYTFSEENIIDSYNYNPSRPLEISADFNVEIMSWHIGQDNQGKDYTFDFVELEGQANTELMCQMIKNKYVNHKAGFIFYGDISGNQRRPEASRTNWAIIKDNFPCAQLNYQDIRNIKDRIDSTNARLKNNSGVINYYITKNCKRLIKDYRQVTWEMLVNKQKAGKLTHASDGETYKFFYKYDLRGKIASKQW